MNPIYVDDIDITECKNLNIVYNNFKGGSEYLCSNSILGKCKDNNCYYKQLQKEKIFNHQIIDELMRDYVYDGEISPNGFDIFDVIKRIKSENIRLKSEIIKANTLIKTILKQVKDTNAQIYELNKKINEVFQ